MSALLLISKSATLSALNVSEIVLLVFGVLLVVGLIGEYHEAWKKWLKMFEMLVIVGVAGELMADGGIFLFSKRLQTLADQEIAGAYERAAKANENAESEKLARIKLEEAYAPRRILAPQVTALTPRLKAFSGETATVWFHAGDREGQVFASDLWRVLKAAGWNVFAPASVLDFAEPGQRTASPIETGVTVSNTRDRLSIDACKAIVNDLRGLGFEAHKSPTPEKRPGAIVIITVGTRPEGAQGEANLSSGENARQR